MKTPRGGISRHDHTRRLTRGLLVLAVVLQGYVSQAHFHNLAASIAAKGTIDLTLGDVEALPGMQPATLPANLPDQHNDKCFVCHLVGLGSVSVLPPIVVLHALSSALVFTDHGDCPTVAAWNSAHAARGPPAPSVQA